MTCSDARDLLHAYADNEVDAATARELEAHLRDCADCKTAFEADRAVKAVAANAALRRPAPNLLRERLIAMKPAPAKPAASRPAGNWWPILNLAASIAILAGLFWIYSGLVTRSPNSSTFADDIVAAHIRSMQIDSHLMDVPSTDQHTVKPWFDGKLDFAPPVHDFKEQEFELIGGRLDYLHNRPVAALVYRRFKHLINVFIWPGDSGDGQDQLNGYNVKHFTAGGMSFWIVSDVNPQDLAAFADLIRQSVSATRP